MVAEGTGPSCRRVIRPPRVETCGAPCRHGMPSAPPIPLREQGSCQSPMAPASGRNRPFGRVAEGLLSKCSTPAYFLCTDWPIIAFYKSILLWPSPHNSLNLGDGCPSRRWRATNGAAGPARYCIGRTCRTIPARGDRGTTVAKFDSYEVSRTRLGGWDEKRVAHGISGRHDAVTRRPAGLV